MVCDHETEWYLHQLRDPLLSEIDECIRFETPGGNALFRSRYLKTSLRSIMEGPFLFLDGDVFVRKSLNPIFELNVDLAIACNHSHTNYEEQVWDSDAETIRLMGWQISERMYFNSGVIFWGDTEKARNLGKEWHHRWLNSFECCGKHQDQPALNAALFAVQPQISILSDRYNAQFKVMTAVAQDAVLWHYYCSAREVPITTFELLVQDLLNEDKLDKRQISAMVKSRHPWRRTSFIDDWAALRICRRNSFNGWESAWLRREIGKYSLARFKAISGQVRRTTERT
jgi:hypothetical protein